jgi:hypothetical protein
MRKRNMKRLKTILTLLIFATGFSSFGQSVNNECDTIYDFAETLPQYENDVKGLMDYLMTDLAPILSDCYKRDDILTASIYLTLTIDKEGKVIDVEFKRIQASEKCKEELKEKLLNMTCWTPGKQGDVSVCCKYQWPISCINWK